MNRQGAKHAKFRIFTSAGQTPKQKPIARQGLVCSDSEPSSRIRTNQQKNPLRALSAFAVQLPAFTARFAQDAKSAKYFYAIHAGINDFDLFIEAIETFLNP